MNKNIQILISIKVVALGILQQGGLGPQLGFRAMLFREQFWTLRPWNDISIVFIVNRL